MAKNVLLEIIIALLVLLFLYAGVTKAMDYNFFATQLLRSPWINGYAGYIAWVVPAFEILIAIMLLLGGNFRKFALFAYAGSLIVFSIYITAVLLSGEKVPCSCGGLIQNLSWPKHILLNLSFAVLAVIAILLQRNKSGIEHINYSYQN